METPTKEEIEQVHAKTAEIHERLTKDTAFRSQYKADPLATLTGAGLPESAAKELLFHAVKAAGKDEVAAYDFYIDRIIWYTDGSELIIRRWYDDYGNFLFEQDIAVG